MTFQLDPSHFKTGNFLIDKVIQAAVKEIDSVDFNKDGVPDIQQIGPVVIKLLPLLVAISHAVDFEQLAARAANSPAVTNKELFKEAVLELGKLAAEAARLLPN